MPETSNDSPTPKPGDSYVQSFARGLAVMRSFSAEAPSQTLSEVAARTGLTRAGARRILLTLETLRYVESDGRQFRLTPRVLDLGFAYLSSMPMWNLAEPLMEDLVDRTGESCSAAVLDSTEIVYVLRVHAHKIMKINLGVGSRLPACFTSLGRVLLAGLPDDAVLDCLRATPRKALTRHTVTGLDELLARVQQARHQGWALVDQELEEGLISIAAPVLDRRGRTVAAINVSGQINRLGVKAMKEQTLPLLRRAAEAVSQRLQSRV